MARNLASGLLTAIAFASALALGGCAMQTESGEPTSSSASGGETLPPESTGTAQAQSGGLAAENTPAPSSVTPAKGQIFPGGARPQPVPPAAAARAEAAASACVVTNSCLSAQDNSTPLPWVTK